MPQSTSRFSPPAHTQPSCHPVLLRPLHLTQEHNTTDSWNYSVLSPLLPGPGQLPPVPQLNQGHRSGSCSPRAFVGPTSLILSPREPGTWLQPVSAPLHDTGSQAVRLRRLTGSGLEQLHLPTRQEGAQAYARSRSLIQTGD